MNTLVIADVHLKVNDRGKQTREAFSRFLRSIDPEKVNTIVFLGDLFDFWFEYQHVVFSGYFDILRALAELKDRGVTLHLVVGNHDFWGGRFLENELAFTIHHTEFLCKMDSLNVLFVHGDGINPEDRMYRIYKKVARSKLAIGMFSLVHPDWAMKLAQGVSQGSRTLRAPDDPSDSKEVHALRRFAQRTLETGRADVVICGHSHYPEELEFPTPSGTGTYINSGDWLERRTYLEWDGERFSRKDYVDLEQNSSD
jgi:UDP-2,3-diacylglucosamine hydrolase